MASILKNSGNKKTITGILFKKPIFQLPCRYYFISCFFFKTTHPTENSEQGTFATSVWTADKNIHSRLHLLSLEHQELTTDLHYCINITIKVTAANPSLENINNKTLNHKILQN